MSISSGSRGPPRPIATTTTRDVSESWRARCPVTAVLPTRFPVPITASVGSVDHRERRRLEPEVGSLVGDSERKCPRDEGKSLARPKDGLVGEVDDDLRLVERDRILEGGLERHAVVLPAAELLGPTDEDSGDDVVVELLEGVTDDGRVVLTVDDGDCASLGTARDHCDLTSRSIRPVYFSYSNVSVENWMIRSCPWNGCRRQMSTWLSVNSITL